MRMLEHFLFFRQLFSFLALHLCAANFFRFSCYLNEFYCLPVCSCWHFRLGGKPIWSVGGGKASGMKIPSLHGESPSHSPPTLCLGPHLLPVSPRSITFFCSSPFCGSFTLPLFSSIPSVLDVTSSGNYAHKPGPMATPFSANSTCPVNRGSLGRRTPFTPPFGEGPLPQPPQSFPQGGVEWFWQTTANVPQGGVGWFSEGKRDHNAARFAWDRGKGDNRHLWRRADVTTTTNVPHSGVGWST